MALKEFIVIVLRIELCLYNHLIQVKLVLKYMLSYFTVPPPFEELGVLKHERYLHVHISLPRGYFGMIVNPARDFGNCIVRTDIVEITSTAGIIVSITNIGVTSQSFSGGSVIARLLVISSPVLATPVFQ